MKQPTFAVTPLETAADYGRFVIEPLEQGFGQTLGNALRRVLLSHISGAAIVSVQIDGVNHQFTTLEGMKEDIVDFILNLKQVRLGYNGSEPVTATLTATGPGKVTAGQFDLPSGVEISNPDLNLSNLADKKSKLSATVTIQAGQGYSPAEERPTNTVGLIPVDAAFSPVTRVNFTVSDTRVGRVTNYDKLTLDIWTNGTVEPLAVLTQAAGILESYFRQIVSPVMQETEVSPARDSNDPEVYRITVEELELPTRIANALRKAGLGTVKQLIAAPKDDIAKIKNLGNKSLEIIEEALQAKGVSFP